MSMVASGDPDWESHVLRADKDEPEVSRCGWMPFSFRPRYGCAALDSLEDVMRGLRGARAGPDAELVPLQSVGAMRIFGVNRVSWISDMPVAARAVALLTANPLEGCTDPPMQENSAYYRKHVAYLMGVGVLRRWDQSGGPVIGVGRYTAVVKEPPSEPNQFRTMARAIFDLRWTNERAVGDDIEFAIATGGALAKLLRSLGAAARRRFRCLHADVKNCYYQIPIGEQLARACAIVCGEVFLPTVLPMGYRKACGITQALMWGIILHVPPGEDSLGAPADASTWEVAPAFVRLEDGGIIVLVYDSILVIATVGNVERWDQRLKRNFAEAGVTLKYCSTEELGATFVFCGVRIQMSREGLSWSLAPDSVQTWKEVASRDVPCTPRGLYTLIGYVRYAADVLGWERWRTAQFGLLQQELGIITQWDDVCVTRGHMKAVSDAVLALQSEEWCHHRSHLRSVKAASTMWMVVDATPKRFAVWTMAEGKVIHEYSEDFPIGMDIALAELYAIMEGLRMLPEGTTCVVVGSDNQAAGRVADRGYGCRPDMSELVGQRSFQGTVIIADVESEHNIADVGTRPAEIFTEDDKAFRTKMSWIALQNAYRIFEEKAVTYVTRATYLNE